MAFRWDKPLDRPLKHLAESAMAHSKLFFHFLEVFKSREFSQNVAKGCYIVAKVTIVWDMLCCPAKAPEKWCISLCRNQKRWIHMSSDICFMLNTVFDTRIERQQLFFLCPCFPQGHAWLYSEQVSLEFRRKFQGVPALARKLCDFFPLLPWSLLGAWWLRK